MNTKLNETLAALTSQRSSGWLEKAAWRKENREWLKTSAVTTLKVLQAMRAQGVNREMLAERMGVPVQQVNRVLKGQEVPTPELLEKLRCFVDPGLNA